MRHAHGHVAHTEHRLAAIITVVLPAGRLLILPSLTRFANTFGEEFQLVQCQGGCLGHAILVGAGQGLPWAGYPLGAAAPLPRMAAAVIRTRAADHALGVNDKLIRQGLVRLPDRAGLSHARDGAAC